MNEVQLSEASREVDLVRWAQSRGVVPTYDGKDKGTNNWKPAVVSSKQIVSKLVEARDQIAAHADDIGDDEDEDATRIDSILSAINEFSRGNHDPAILETLNSFRPDRLLELELEVPIVSDAIDKIATLTAEEANSIRCALEYEGSSFDHKHLLTFADSLKGPSTVKFRPVLQSASFWSLIPDSASILHGRVQRNNCYNGRLKVSKPFALTREPMDRDAAVESKLWLKEAGAAMGKEYSTVEMIALLSTTFGVKTEVMEVVFPHLVKEVLSSAPKYSFQSNSQDSTWIMSQVQGRDGSLEVTADGLQLLTL